MKLHIEFDSNLEDRDFFCENRPWPQVNIMDSVCGNVLRREVGAVDRFCFAISNPLINTLCVGVEKNGDGVSGNLIIIEGHKRTVEKKKKKWEDLGTWPGDGLQTPYDRLSGRDC